MTSLTIKIILALLVKLGCIALFSYIFRKWCKDYLESIVASWLTVNLITIGFMLLLSGFHAVNRIGLLACFTGLSLLLIKFAIDQNKAAGNNQFKHDLALFTEGFAPLALVTLIIIFAALSYRSFYFYDNTWDAIVYELPRISVYAQHMTLFIHEPTHILNIFVNEWNGELNALYYVAATQNDQASSFGNVEVWLFSVFIAAWFMGSILDVPKRWQLLSGITILSLPACVALAMTVKGDLLSISGSLLTVGWFLRYYKERDNHLALVMHLCSLGLLAGAKASLLPTILLMTAFTLILFIFNRPYKKHTTLALAIGLLGFLTGSARYIANLFVYGNPLQRIAVESPHIDILNLWNNGQGIIKSILGNWITPLYSNNFFWILSQGMGYLGVILLFIPIIFYFKTKSNQSSVTDTRYQIRLLGLYLPFTTGLMITATTLTWFPWSFRYFLPWIIIGFTYCLSQAFRFVDKKRGMTWCFAYLLAAISLLHAAACFQKGEAYPTSFRSAYQHTQLERKMALWPFLVKPKENTIAAIPVIANGKGNILLFSGADQAIYPFWGPDHSNKVELVASTDDLLNKAAHFKYDLIVITRMPDYSADAAERMQKMGFSTKINRDDIEQKLQAIGYHKQLHNDFWTILAI